MRTKSVHQEARGAGLLRPDVRHLMGRLPPGGRSWRLREHQLANRCAVPVRGPGDARRPQRRRRAVDPPHRWKAGLREVLRRLLRWRVGARWYAVALLPAPLLAAAVLFALSLSSPIFTTADKTAVLLSGIAAGLTTVLEEIGWTGFAVPRLRRRYGVVTTGLIVGVLWGAWHFLQGLFISGTYAGVLPLALVPAREFLRGCRATDGLQGAPGVGLRPYREPAGGDAHARKSHRQHDLHLHASGDRGVLLELCVGIGRGVLVSLPRSPWPTACASRDKRSTDGSLEGVFTPTEPGA